MPIRRLELPGEPRILQPEPDTLSIMTRIVRLPTTSPREARRIVSLQLDRLSPLPRSEILFDLVSVRRDAAETVYALAVVRRDDLATPDWASAPTVTVRRAVEGDQISFKFHNPFAASRWERRWLKHAPQAAIVALGIAGLGLAIGVRAADWRDLRMDDIAEQARVAERDRRVAEQITTARTIWTQLERQDAATRWLCVTSHPALARASTLTIAAVQSSPKSFVITLAEGQGGDHLTDAGFVTDEAGVQWSLSSGACS